MIENDLQLEVTKTQLEFFKKELTQCIRDGHEIDDIRMEPILFIAMIQGIQSEIDSLEAQIDAYYTERLIQYGLIERPLDNSEEV
jgi:hypothetical protein